MKSEEIPDWILARLAYELTADPLITTSESRMLVDISYKEFMWPDVEVEAIKVSSEHFKMISPKDCDLVTEEHQLRIMNEIEFQFEGRNSIPWIIYPTIQNSSYNCEAYIIDPFSKTDKGIRFRSWKTNGNE